MADFVLMNLKKQREWSDYLLTNRKPKKKQSVPARDNFTKALEIFERIKTLGHPEKMKEALAKIT